MSEKKALIFDTNFILINPDLIIVVDKLKDEFNVYVTQISIEERLSQYHREFEQAYKDLSKGKKRLRSVAKISINRSFEESVDKIKGMSRSSYQKLFGERIIPFSQCKDIFPKVLERALLKIPPFISENNASDKGFKDTIMWLSLLEYFRDHGENEMVFITDDNGFRKNAESLCEEFHQHTGKTISIVDNSFYDPYKFPDRREAPEKETKKPVKDINLLREKINMTINALRLDEWFDEYGRPDWASTFSLNQKVDSTYMERIFMGLEQCIDTHLFESSVPASCAFDLDDRVIDQVPIQISDLENALSLYKEIEQNLPEYLPQFYSASAIILNKNYKEPQNAQEFVDDDDLPF